MQIKNEKINGLTATYDVVIAPEAMAKALEDRLQALTKTVKIAGFRPGKVPLNVIKQRYGDAVRGEAMEKAVETAVSQLLKDKDIKPAMRPQISVSKFEDDNTIEFNMVVEQSPKIDVGDLSAIAVTKLVAPVETTEINAFLERLANSRQSTETVAEARPAKIGDVARINFAGTVNGEALPGMSAENFDLELGSNSFVPGFEDQLVGLKTGDKADINVTFPSDYGHPQLAGQPTVFAVEILELREKVKATLNDDLAKKFGFDNLQAWQDKARGALEMNHDRMSQTRMKRTLLDALDKAYMFEVPAGVVDAEYKQIWHYHIEDVKERGLDVADAEKDDSTKAEFRTIAQRRVRLGMLLAEIGRQQNVQVTAAEINRAIMQQAQQYPGQEQRIMKHYKQNPEAVNQVTAPLFEEKVVAYILSQAKVTDQQVSLAELERDPDAEAEEARLAAKK
jgi:trigger factor